MIYYALLHPGKLCLGYNMMGLWISAPGKRQAFKACPVTGCCRKNVFSFQPEIQDGWQPSSGVGSHLETPKWDSSGNWTSCAAPEKNTHDYFYFLVQRTNKSNRCGVLLVLQAQWLILFPCFSCTWKHVSREGTVLYCLWLQKCHKVGITRRQYDVE